MPPRPRSIPKAAWAGGAAPSLGWAALRRLQAARGAVLGALLQKKQTHAKTHQTPHPCARRHGGGGWGAHRGGPVYEQEQVGAATGATAQPPGRQGRSPWEHGPLPAAGVLVDVEVLGAAVLVEQQGLGSHVVDDLAGSGGGGGGHMRTLRVGPNPRTERSTVQFTSQVCPTGLACGRLTASNRYLLRGTGAPPARPRAKSTSACASLALSPLRVYCGAEAGECVKTQAARCTRGRLHTNFALLLFPTKPLPPA